MSDRRQWMHCTKIPGNIREIACRVHHVRNGDRDARFLDDLGRLATIGVTGAVQPYLHLWKFGMHLVDKPLQYSTDVLLFPSS